MIIRAIILTLLLAGALGWFAFEQERGGARPAEEEFLDFLVANARDSLTKDAAEQSQDVVLVEIREEDKAEYSAWPPAPIDYIMILKRLAEHEPQVLAVVEPLRWEKVETEFVTQLRNALVPFPWVILGTHLGTDAAKTTPEQSEFAAGSDMPVLPAAEGGVDNIPAFTHVAKLSDWSLRIASQTGFSAIEGSAPSDNAIPLVARQGDRLTPSLAAQAVTLFRHQTYSEERLRFGTGARLSLGETFIIPLRDDGALPLHDRPRVPTVNALELMTPDLGDTQAKTAVEALGKGKVVVLGNRPDSMLQARAIATALAMPKVERGPASTAWGLAAVACLFCYWQLRHRRLKTLVFGALAMIVGLGASLLAFQSSLIWCSPLAALLALVTGTLFCFLWPAKRVPHAPPDANNSAEAVQATTSVTVTVSSSTSTTKPDSQA